MNGGHSTGRHISPAARLSAIWRNRRVLWLLIRRDLKVRYANSLLGYVWSVLDPLVMGLIYWFVFTVIFHRSVGEEPYIVFLLSALLPWLWFQIGLTEGAKSIISQEKLVRSTAVPREIWVLRSVCARGIEFLFSLPVLILFLVVYHPPINIFILLFPLGILLQFLLLAGVSMFLAPLMVMLKDIDPLVRLALRALFYASPTIYGINDILGNTAVPKIIQDLYLLNPLAGIMSAYRAGIFASELSVPAILSSLIITLATFVLGCVFFGRSERTVLKEI
ncbi:ABC transporter permease [Schaalia sp. ZJ405]|uniref:ABC transporter permease n=1 Tax=unclassified Schaalia TaxID=2691889 RepID=UPI0013EADD66|nr:MULTISPECIES: ABC transporter permease [unclassified Schaalia]QPK80732.1 ABC transporter permease [Schaalia sp. ZJ405]